MILSDSDILERVKAGDLVIKPFSKRRLSPSGYDLSLAPEWKVYLEKPSVALDPYEKTSSLDVKEIKSNEFLLSRGAVLARSLEYLKIPLDIMGQVLIRSGFARLGLFCNVAPLDAGWEGYLTIEISNIGNRPVILYSNRPFCQLFFHVLSSKPIKPYRGKYQRQKRIELSKLYKEGPRIK